MATVIHRRYVFFDRMTFSWTAVLAGVATALIIQVMLTMFGLGIGLISIDTATAADTPIGVSWAAFLYWAAAGILAAFAGGCVAGAVTAPGSGGAHGLAAWAVATLVVVGAGMLAAGNSASIASNVLGPTAISIARYDRVTADENGNGAGTVGQAMPANKEEIEQARRHVAAGMLGSFIALLLGALAAFAGGWMSNSDDEARVVS